MFDFEVKIVYNQEEIRQALKLRYEVFKLELAKQKEHFGLDAVETDIYDKFCDHLIVIDKTVNKVVGTYRLLLGSKVDKELGFYSEKFFDLRNIKKLAKKHQILELGRSCIHRDYRCRPVINLLWSGIAKYIKDYDVRYLFGSVRLWSNEPVQVSKTFKFIKERFYASPELRVYPKEKNKFKGLKRNIEIKDSKEIFRHLPPLVKGYIRAGVKVCGLPAINPDLGSVVIFILLDIEKIPPSYKKHFF